MCKNLRDALTLNQDLPVANPNGLNHCPPMTIIMAYDTKTTTTELVQSFHPLQNQLVHWSVRGQSTVLYRLVRFKYTDNNGLDTLG